MVAHIYFHNFPKKRKRKIYVMEGDENYNEGRESVRSTNFLVYIASAVTFF